MRTICKSLFVRSLDLKHICHIFLRCFWTTYFHIWSTAWQNFYDLYSDFTCPSRDDRITRRWSYYILILSFYEYTKSCGKTSSIKLYIGKRNKMFSPSSKYDNRFVLFFYISIHNASSSSVVNHWCCCTQIYMYR